MKYERNGHEDDNTMVDNANTCESIKFLLIFPVWINFWGNDFAHLYEISPFLLWIKTFYLFNLIFFEILFRKYLPQIIIIRFLNNAIEKIKKKQKKDICNIDICKSSKYEYQQSLTYWKMLI